MTWLLATMAVFALGLAWLVCARYAERKRVAEIRREMQTDHVRRERLDQLAKWQRDQEWL